MQASAATHAPISGIPVLEIVPGDVPVTLLSAPRVERPSGPSRNVRALIAAAERFRADRAPRSDEAPTTMRGPELAPLSWDADALTQRVFAEEPAELDHELLGAHRKSAWLAASSFSAWAVVLGAALLWLLTSAVLPLRAEVSGASRATPRIAEPAIVDVPPVELTPEAPPAPAAPVQAAKPALTPAPIGAPEGNPFAEEETAAAAENAAAPTPAADATADADLSDNPYGD